MGREEYGFMHEQAYVRAFKKEYYITPGKLRSSGTIIQVLPPRLARSFWEEDRFRIKNIAVKVKEISNIPEGMMADCFPTSRCARGVSLWKGRIII